jgi:hypothetical protein
LIKFSGVVTASDGKPATGAVPLTFTLYNAPEEGANLWTETQSAQLDAQGHYTVLLGAASTAGLPLDLFASGTALWLGVQPDLAGAGELPRVLLVAVPYALKAADADTLGGKPASAYVLSQDQTTSPSGQATSGNLAAAASQTGQGVRPGQRAETSTANQNASPASPVGGSGLTNFIPLWTGQQTLGNSIMFQALDKVGVGTKTPGARLEAVSPDIAVRGTSYSPNGTGVSGIDTASSGYTNGVYGEAASTSGNGVFGNATATSGITHGVYGQSASPSGAGVFGGATALSGGYGVFGMSASPDGTGVFGVNNAASGGSGVPTGVTGVATPTSGTTVGVNAANFSTAGGGVVGAAWATSGPTFGVSGASASTNGIGVIGYANATSGPADGVIGTTASTGGIGVQGVATATSGNPVGVYGATSGGGFAVWGAYGFSPTSITGVGVKGSIEAGAASGGVAGQFINVPGQGLILQGISGYSTQVFSVDANGNLDISGNLTVAGSKSARVKLQDGREVALYAVESPENWFEDFGTAQLQGGAVAVSLEPGFLQTVDTAADYHVFLTPKGDCHGLYVASTTSQGFEVRELGGGNASIAFDYRIVAHRRGFDKVRLQEVHPPQVSPEVKAGLASMPPRERVVVPPPPRPRITIPVIAHAPAQVH